MLSSRVQFRPLLPLLGILAALGLGGGAAPLAGQDGVLWVGETRGALRIATADGAVLGEIDDVGHVRALGVDPVGERVWLYSWHRLSAYGLDGEPELSVSVPGLPLAAPKMAVDPVAGTVWLAGLVRLLGFDGAGQGIAQEALPELVRSLAADPAAGVVWVAGARDLYGYDTTSGLAVETISLGPGAPPIRAVAVDAESALWVATRDDLRRLGPDGSEELRVAIPGLVHVAADGAGGAWAAGLEELVRVAADGTVVATAEPFSFGGWIVDLAADGLDGSVWAANLGRLARVEGDGEVTVERGLGFLVLVRDLDLWRPPVPPSVTIEAPAEGAAVATGTPELLLAFTPGDQPLDLTSLAVAADGFALAVSCELDAAGGPCTPVAPLPDGPVTLTVTVDDVTGLASEPASVGFTVDTVAPGVTVTAPVDGALTNQPEQLVTGSVSEPVALLLDGSPVAVAPDLTFHHGPVPLAEGVNALTLTATDPAGNVGEVTVTVTLDTVAPAALDPAALAVSAPADGVVTVTGAPGAAEPGTTVTVTHAGTGAAASAEAAPDGSFTVALPAAAGDLLSARQIDRAGNPGPAIELQVPAPDPGEDLPPDPATVAPPLDRTVATDLAAATEFLYTGPDPIQPGVAPGAIEAYRAAVVRGRVVDRDGAPLPGVRISVRDRPEYGSTLSREDGRFDFAVNGGGSLTLDYEKDGFLPAQRPVEMPWRDWTWADEVVLVLLAPQATVITSGAAEVQVARGAPEEDADGPRTATLLFPAGTSAERVLPDGSREPLPSFTVRATEYTVGESGPRAMPGPLPDGVGYTYAVELSADEALAAGARSVEFSQPAFLYVENFVGFPVGGIVPAGWYDREVAAWVASDNGRVIEVVGVDGAGRAEIDFDGDGAAESAGDLAELGFTDGERAELASLYPASTELWRTPIPHLTPWDCNWPFAPPEDAVEPPEDELGQDEGRDEDDSPCDEGSIIECENQILGESLPIVGTPFRLHYRSDRLPGRTAVYTLPIRLSGPSVPASLKRIELEIQVAGQLLRRTFPPSPNQELTFTWDGRDAYGRPLQGAAEVQVTKVYVYDLVYTEPGDFDRSWGRFSRFRLTGGRQDAEVGLRRTSQYSVAFAGRATLGGWDATAQRLGGWTVGVHHAYDPTGRKLWLGDGRRRSASGLPPLLHGVSSVSPGQIAFGPDGSLYVVEGEAHRVLRRDRSGPVTVFAGDGTPCEPPDPDDPAPPTSCGDGGPAVAAQLFEPNGVDVASDGSVLIADDGNNCVRRVDTEGVIHTVAGQCDGGFGGGPVQIVASQGEASGLASRNTGSDCEGCPATEALLDSPWDVVAAPWGGFYFSERHNHRVRYVGTDGRMVTVAGGGFPADGLGDGGPATEAEVSTPRGIALGPDGSLYIAHASRVRRVTTDGRISTVAGSSPGFCGDGGPAVEACLLEPFDVHVAPDGSLLIADTASRRLRRVSPSGIIDTIAGSEDGPFAEDSPGSAAAGAVLDFVHAVTTSPDGSIFLAQPSAVLRVGQSLEGLESGEVFIPDTGGRHVFVFDAEGRHLRTVDSLTGTVLYRFRYDSAGLLLEIEDRDGQVTRIERTGSGAATAIVGPFGQRTLLRQDADGYLAEVEDPAGEVFAFTYSSEGLLEEMTDPRGNRWTYIYAGFGQLARAEDPAGGFKTLLRAGEGESYTVDVTTALGRTTSYTVERGGPGERSRLRRDPDGALTTWEDRSDGSTFIAYPDGSTLEAERAADPRWGLLAPIPGQSTLETPGGLLAGVSTERQVTLSDPNDPLAVETLVDTVNVNGETYTRAYDASSRRFTLTTPEGRQRFVTLDAQGRTVQAEVPGIAPVELTYDPLGRLAEIAQGAGAERRTVSFGFDTLGWLSTITDPLGRSVGFSRDDAGRVTVQTLPDGRTLGFGYDPNGNLSSLTPPGRPAHTFSFTPLNLPEGYDPPDIAGVGSDTTGYAFDLDRRLAAVNRPGGGAIEAAYEAETGRLSSVALPGGEGLGFGYEPTSGELASISGPAGEAVTFTYDGFFLTGTTWSGEVSGSVERAYDENLRIVRRTVNGSDPVAFGYDRDGLLVTAGDLALTRDPAHGLVTGTALGQVTTSRTYNEFGELAQESAAFDGTEIYRVSYTRDALGRIVEKTETIGGVPSTWGYEYDLAGRLTTVTHDGLPFASYTYDANGNRLTYDGPFGSITATYDDQDRLLAYGDTSYTYSAAGELLSKTQGAATADFDYDALGNLRGVTLSDGIEIEYVVDGETRRVGKKVGGSLVRGFLYRDHLNPVAQLDGTGAVTARFIYGSRHHSPDLMIRGDTTYRILTDHLGSVRLVVDVATAEVAQRLDYDEFGRVILDTNPGFQPFGFAGGLYDPQTGLVRFGARDYDPEVGRWTAKDPVGFDSRTTNLYLYIQNDPVNSFDVTGLHSLCFDGSDVHYYDDQGQELRTYPATSGIGGETDPSVPFKGPIPPGRYELRPGEISEARGLHYLLRNFLGDWGHYRVPLHPKEETDTLDRDGFFLHGGEEPGTAGCVDVGPSDKELFPELRKHKGAIPFDVKSSCQ